MSLPLHSRAVVNGLIPAGLYKILGAAEALVGQYPAERVIVDLRSGPSIDRSSLSEFGFAGVIADSSLGGEGASLHSLSNDRAIGEGDVIRLREDGKLDVLFRRGANANSLFITEACNSKCLMCSQPPRDIDDSWRVPELLHLITLIDDDLSVLGVTGGEPTLPGLRLPEILEHASQCLPHTTFHVLTNGRRFKDSAFCSQFERLLDRITWAVPVYADTAALHDRVVDVEGAFVETMHGLYNLAEHGHRIEIRMVVSGLTLPRLVKTAEFYRQNLPFADHFALMGLEPMGYARKNSLMLEYDHRFCNDALLKATSLLDQAWPSRSTTSHCACWTHAFINSHARASRTGRTTLTPLVTPAD